MTRELVLIEPIAREREDAFADHPYVSARTREQALKDREGMRDAGQRVMATKELAHEFARSIGLSLREV